MKPAHKLTLLDTANRLYPDTNLSEVTVIACQHFFVANFLMFEKLFEKNLRPERTFVIPKPYTHNPTVERLLRDRGVLVWQYTYDSHEAFDKRMHDETVTFVEFLKREKLKPGAKLLILDDGGDLVRVANEHLREYPRYGVEQTSSGFNKLKGIELAFPVVNIARSGSKLNIESLFIAERMCFKTMEFLHEKAIEPERCLVLGNGPIGGQVFRILSNYYPTDVFDIERERSGRTGALAELIGEYDLIFACAGKTCVPAELHSKLRPNAVLVSASLREFEPHVLRQKVERTHDSHAHLNIEGRWLVNSGFPVNPAVRRRRPSPGRQKSRGAGKPPRGGLPPSPAVRLTGEASRPAPAPGRRADP
jgi:hypothetical protein